MRKKIIFWILSVLISEFLYVQGLDQLSESVALGIIDFFAGKDNVKASIIRFENFSGHSDLIAQKFYQLLVSKLEIQKNIHFKDAMINFNRKQGQFNLSNAHQFNYLISMKMIKNREKLGVGVTVFSRSLDKIVGIYYRETVLEEGERDVLDTNNFGFQSAGFSKILEIEAERKLLDIKTAPDANGEFHYFFYYPEKINVFHIQNDQLGKKNSMTLNWGRPFYPVLEPEGKLCVFKLKQGQFLSAGNNFSPSTKIFLFQNGQLAEVTHIDFVPFLAIELNGRLYLTGSQYDKGRNFFQEKIIFFPLDSGNLDSKEYLEKKIPSFFGFDFVVEDGKMISAHMIDREYQYRFFTADLEEQGGENEKRGSAISSLNGQWLAMADYSRDSDRLFFYKVVDGGKNLVYQNAIDGEIVFISAGNWKSWAGFWVYTKKIQKYGEDFFLQFWSKADDPENNLKIGERDN